MDDNELQNNLEKLHITTLPTVYYTQLVDKFKIYPGIEILNSPDELITIKSIANIKCPHKIRLVQVRTLLNAIGCTHCVKDKLIKDKHEELFIPAENSAEYIKVALVDETSPGFLNLKITEKNRKTTQNIIVKKLDSEQIDLITEYKNFDSEINYVCKLNHVTITSYSALNKLKINFCKDCRKLKTSTCTHYATKKQATEEDLIKAAIDIGWTHVKKTGKGGIIEWMCPQGHIVSKVLRELLRGRCSKCAK